MSVRSNASVPALNHGPGDGVKTWERAGFVQTLFMRCDDTAKGGVLVQTI